MVLTNLLLEKNILFIYRVNFDTKIVKLKYPNFEIASIQLTRAEKF